MEKTGILSNMKLGKEKNKYTAKNDLKNRIIFMLLLLLVPVIWGGGFLITANTLSSGLTTPEILVSRFFIAAVSLYIFRAVLGIKKSPLKEKFTKKDLLSGLIAGTINFFGFYFQTLGLEKTDSARSAMITGAYVVLVPIAYCFLYKKFRLKTIINAVAFFIGLVVLAGVGAEESFNMGDFLTILCAIFFAAQIMIVDRLKGVNAVNFTILQMLTMAVIGLIPMAFSGGIPFSKISFGEGIIPLLYLGVLSSGYAYIVQTFAQKRISPSLTSIILSLESLASVLLSLAFKRVQWSASLAIGCLIMIAATISASLDDNNLPVKPETEKIPSAEEQKNTEKVALGDEENKCE